MKIKIKILALITIMILIFNSISVFAEENLNEDVKNAIAAVKSKINIDEGYDKFSYEILNEYGHTIYSIKCRNEYGENCIVKVDSDGSLIRYELDYYYDSSILLNVKQEEAKANAESFIRKVIPERANELELLETTSDYKAFTFKFAQKINGNFVMCDDTEVKISRKNGNVIYFSSYGKYFQNKINREADLIGREKAKDAFFDNKGIRLIYHSDFNSETKHADIYPVYEFTPISINAHNSSVTNSLLSIVPEEIDEYLADQAAMDAWYDELMSIERVEETDGFISEYEAKESAVKYNLIEPYTYLPGPYVKKSKYNKDEYLWNFSGYDNYGDLEESYDFDVDANSGKIVKFSKSRFKDYDRYYYYGYSKDDEDLNKKTIFKDEAKDKIYKYLNLLCPELLNDLSYNDDITYDKENNRYSIEFKRKINDIEFDSNYVSISVDAEAGELFGFNKVWYNDIDIIDNPININKDDAFAVYEKDADFKLCYAYVINESSQEYNSVDAVYRALNDFDYYIDAESGEKISYSEEDTEIEENELDLSDSKYAEEIKTLYDSGFYLNKNEFNPNKNMTKRDFIEFLYSVFEEDYFQRNLKISKEDILSKIDSVDDFMTKNDCAKILMYIMDCKEIADEDEIFDNIYSDVPLENRAEVSIVTSLSIIEADEDNFNGDKIISNEEGAHIIYNLIFSYWDNRFKS